MKYKTIKINGVIKAEHRFVMEKFLGRNLDSHEYVHHIDGDGLNNDISNLDLSNSSSHARCHIKTSPIYGKGEENHQSKLTKEDIPWIRLWLKKGFGKWNIGKAFGVDHATIRDIRDGITWVSIC